jgi:hypothetical protein
VVGPGVSTFYFAESGSGWTSSLVSFFDGIKARHPNTIAWSIPNHGDLIDVASGEITGTWTDGTANAVPGTGTIPYMQGVGYRFVWSTGGIRSGRRVKGSTFMCPMDGGMLDAAGTLGTVQITALNTLAASLITASTHDMRIYSKPHKGAADGISSSVESVTVPDAISWLRSRRT